MKRGGVEKYLCSYNEVCSLREESQLSSLLTSLTKAEFSGIFDHRSVHLTSDGLEHILDPHVWEVKFHCQTSQQEHDGMCGICC